MTIMDTIGRIYDFLNKKGWVVLDDPEEQISLLYSGEHNTNYLITVSELYGEARYVFRVNHSSRLGLTDQIEYEFAVLQALRRSGVTPRPFYCDANPGAELGNGVLLMEYLEGRPLNYGGDWQVAAQILARVHSVSVDGRLIVQKNPVWDFARECQGLIHGFRPMPNSDDILVRLGECVEELETLAGEFERLVEMELPVIVNGGACSSDFLIDDNGENKIGKLVDWECGVISSRYVDIGQFFAQACQVGEFGYCRDEGEKQRFAQAYIDAGGFEISVSEVVRCATLYEKAIISRSRIWNCVALGDIK